MKAVLISIKPKWCDLIRRGRKTVEVRKTCPKLEVPFKVYIYETMDGGRGSGLVFGEFTCTGFDVFRPIGKGISIKRFPALYESCLTLDEIVKYAQGEPVYGWQISQLKLYEEPLKLEDFSRHGFCGMNGTGVCGNLAIPLNMEAKNAGSPRKFNDLRFIPISPGYGFLVRDRKHPQKAPGRKKQEKHDAKKHPSGGEEDPRPNEDYEWMYMLVDSVTIPERSFIRASFDTGKATLENICKEAVDGIILKKWTAQEAADYIGKWAVEMTHDYFNTKLSPPKSATTQLTSTQYQPLFDTGRLYNSISYSVEGI